jgi:exopolysaccharide biosynthesis WecB/TagA/CpsF family protein
LFDFVSGEKRRAPFWMQRAGFEWLFRLCCEPRRLFLRYAGTSPHAMLVMLLSMR